MNNLLFLVHRIPYPPNKGDKIRSYNFLKGLAKNYHIHLATFIDDSEDSQYVTKVQDLTASSLFINLNPSLAKLKSISGLIMQQALTLPYYKSNELHEWVDKTILDNKIEKIFVFSSAMAQYVLSYKDLDIVVDFVDVDSDKWLQYSQKASWPMSWVYKREAKLLLEFDNNIANLARMNIFVSQEEADLFKRLVEINENKINYVNNGVDTDYFNINRHYQTPYTTCENIIVFTGAMDYWANIDAVTWFVKHVFTQIKQIDPHAKFYIVGSKPAKEVMQLANVEGVFVTGSVEDIRPYIVFANVVVAPLQIARGIQNKVLEAMALGKRIVATPQAIEGINIDQQEVIIANNAEDFARQTLSFLSNSQVGHFVQENHDFVAKHHSWATSHKRLIDIID